MFKLLMVVLILFFQFPFKGSAETPNFPVKTAFIRNGNLWTLINNKEEQVTKTGKIFNPLWSYDGKWIAYQHEAPAELPYGNPQQYELWVYNVATKQNEEIFRNADAPQWAPNKDIIAYQDQGVLDVSTIEHFYNVALGVRGFAWFPDGSGFLLASQADRLPDGWTNPIIYKKVIGPLDKINLEKDSKRFFILPKEVGLKEKKVLSIEAGSFNYSPSGKWISFIVSPTASWSMDSNMLCILSNNGSVFNVLDEVILGVGQPKWAPSKDIIAYIAGGGRLVAGFQNKKLKWKELPVNSNLTPANYAELDFTWINNKALVTSRVKEKAWSNDPKMHPLPSLYTINLSTLNESYITQPPEGFGDYHPKYIKRIQKLIWIRRRSMFDQNGTLWISNPNGTNKKAWLKNVADINVYQP